MQVHLCRAKVQSNSCHFCRNVDGIYTLPLYTVARSINNSQSFLTVKRLKTRNTVMDVEDLVLAGTKQRSAKNFCPFL